MRMLGFLLTVCLALAVLRAVAVTFVLALLAALVVGAVLRPLQTAGLLFGLALLSAFERHPLVGLLAITAMSAVSLIGSKGR